MKYLYIGNGKLEFVEIVRFNCKRTHILVKLEEECDANAFWVEITDLYSTHYFTKDMVDRFENK